MKKVLLLIVIIFLLTGCSLGKQWTGFYYPDGLGFGIDESRWQIEGGFKSKGECLDWIDEVSSGNTNFDYECGKKCKYNSEFDGYICKTTEK